MRLYRITATKEDCESLVTWAGSQADASSTRKRYTEQGFKRAGIETEEVDVPTNKEGLLAFLNERRC